MACAHAGISKAELSRKLGYATPQAFQKRYNTGKFTQEELQEIAQATGGRYISFWIPRRYGNKIKEVTKIFANVIRKILQDCEDEGHKVTQVELARVLGISRQAFTNKMTRDSFFIDDVVKIADYLNMKVVLKGEKEYIIEKED